MTVQFRIDSRRTGRSQRKPRARRSGCGLAPLPEPRGQLRRRGVRRLALRVQRPHRRGARPLARQPVEPLPPAQARRRRGVGRAAHADAAAGSAAGGPRRQAVPRRRPELPQRGRRGSRHALGRRVRVLRPRDRQVDRARPAARGPLVARRGRDRRHAVRRRRLDARRRAEGRRGSTRPGRST